MNKQQFIDKSLKEFRDQFAMRTFDNATILEFNNFLQSKLSECWDMAEQAHLRTLDDVKQWIKGQDSVPWDEQVDDFFNSLTPKQEEVEKV